jgi:ankyrin repeat protein
MDASDHANLDIVRHLIEKGADINVKDNEGRTALDLARENGYTIVVEYLESLQ